MIPISSRTPTAERRVGAREGAVPSSSKTTAPTPVQVPIARALIPARGEE